MGSLLVFKSGSGIIMKLLILAFLVSFVFADLEVEELRRTLLKVQEELAKKKYEEIKRQLPFFGAEVKNETEKKELEAATKKKIHPVYYKEAENVKRGCSNKPSYCRSASEIGQCHKYAACANHCLCSRKRSITEKEELQKKVQELNEAAKKEIQKRELQKKVLELNEVAKKEIEKKELQKKMEVMIENVKREMQKKEVEQNLISSINNIKKRTEEVVKKEEKRGWFSCVGENQKRTMVNPCCDDLLCYMGDGGYNPVGSGKCLKCFGYERTCTKDSQCCDNMQCDKQKAIKLKGVCKPKRPIDGPCVEDNQCESTFCLEHNKNMGLGSGKCFQPGSLPSSAACIEDRQCASI